MQGIAAIGDSFMKLGQIGLNRQKLDDDKQRYIDEKNFNQTKFDWEIQRAKDDAAARKQEFKTEILLKNKELKLQEERNRALESYYASLRDEAGYKRKKQIAEDKANVAIYKEIYPEQSKGKSDDEILALGNIMQRLKSGKKDNSIELIKVDSKFYNEYAHLGVVKNTKDGFYADKAFVDELANQAEAMSEAKGNQAGYKERVGDLKKSKPLIFGDDGAM